MFAKFIVPTGRTVVLALAFAAFAAPVRAQQPSPAAMASARELMELKGVKDLVEPVVVGVIQQTRDNILQTNPGLSKDLDEVSTQLRTEYEPRTVAMTNEIAQLYAQRFTEQELKEAVAFYKSPVGKKLLVEEPKIVDETYARIRQWASKLQDDVTGRVRGELKKRGHNL
ncbi:MAG TPA: DUF2059 domain-containing protein [Xanthobacteraceae bacterium]|nr:DUF2059 domain-containing protein [Xanthobacteraceae bacterium]